MAMGSRIRLKKITKRLGWWEEPLGFLGETQAGFNNGRSTSDVAQAMISVHEDVADCNRKVNE